MRSGECKALGSTVTVLPSPWDPGSIRSAVHMRGSQLSSFVAKMVPFPIQAAFQTGLHLPGHCSGGRWPARCGISITLSVLSA